MCACVRAEELIVLVLVVLVVLVLVVVVLTVCINEISVDNAEQVHLILRAMSLWT